MVGGLLAGYGEGAFTDKTTPTNRYKLREQMDKWEIFREIQKARLTPNQYRVLICYWEMSNNDTLIAFPGTTTISNTCQMSYSSVRRARSELVALGWLIPLGTKENGKKYKGCLVFEVSCGVAREGKDFTRPMSEAQKSYAKAQGLYLVE